MGRRVSEANSNHSRSFTSDALGRVKTSTDALTGAVVTSEYDAEGRRTRVTEGGVDRRFEYDARGLLRRLQLGTSGWLDVTHDALGRRTSVTRPNGVRSDWVYDDVGQLTSVLHTRAGVVLDGFSYTYDSHGRRDSKTRTDGTSEAYTYDAVDRLTRVDEATGRSSVYVLDAVGNRSSLTVTQPGVPAVVTTSSSNAFNQLRTSSRNGVDTAYVYDANGNLASETEGTATPTTYTWDADNRLRQVAQPTLLSTYEYDANGLRVKKVEGAVETRFLLDGASVVAEYDSSNTATRRYLQNPEAIDDILEFTEAGQAYFPLTDALGSVVAITNSSGVVVTRNSYEVYGARTTTGAGPQWAFGFTGREQDASGWRYHRDRYANADTSRFAQYDRYAKPPLDGYGYADQTPTERIDPSGRAAIWVDGFGAGTAQARQWIPELQINGFDIDNGLFNVEITTFIGGHRGRTHTLSEFMSELVSPVDFEFSWCAWDNTRRIYQLWPNAQFHKVSLYSNNFRPHPWFIPAIMLRTWIISSLLFAQTDPSVPDIIGLVPSAMGTDGRTGHPIDLFADEIVTRIYPGVW